MEHASEEPTTKEGPMATKADFTEDEWEALRKGASGAGLLVAVSDRGFFDTFKEAGSLAKNMSAAQTSGASELVRELAKERPARFGLTSKPDEVETETVDALRTAATALKTKAPDELDAYRKFVLDLAATVAGAAEGGDEAEAGATEKIKAALG
jgi:hypothetical protein